MKRLLVWPPNHEKNGLLELHLDCRTPRMPLRQWRAGEKLRRQHPHSSCQFVICACAWVKAWAPMDQGTKGPRELVIFGILVNHLLFEADMISMLQFFQVC